MESPTGRRFDTVGRHPSLLSQRPVPLVWMGKREWCGLSELTEEVWAPQQRPDCERTTGRSQVPSGQLMIRLTRIRCVTSISCPHDTPLAHLKGVRQSP